MSVTNDAWEAAMGILRGVPTALIISDQGGTILEVNEAAEQLLACSSQNLVGSSIAAIFTTAGSPATASNNWQELTARCSNPRADTRLDFPTG